jgi:DNA polymerase-1
MGVTKLLTAKEAENKIANFSDRGDGKYFCSIDLETTGLDYEKDNIRLLSFCIASPLKGIICEGVVDCFENSHENVESLLYKVVNSDLFIVGHNLAFDLRFITNYLKLPNHKIVRLIEKSFCTYLTYLNFTLGTGSRYEAGLLDVCSRYGICTATDENVRAKRKMQASDWTGKLTDEQIEYSLNDSRLVAQLCLTKPFSELLWDRMEGVSPHALLNKIDIYSQFILSGEKIYVDVERAETLRGEFSLLKYDIEDKLISYVGGDMFGLPSVNLNSPQVLRKILKNDFGVETKHTDELNLKRIAAANADFSELCQFINLVLDYREIGKLITFFEGFEEGFIRPSWNVLGADSGRITCSKPNIQQYPKKTRAVFRPRKGCKFIKADYSQMELRLAAWVTGDTKMCRAFANDIDVHAQTAEAVFGKKWTPEHRQIAKSMNFGLIYGMGPVKLKDYLLLSGVNVSLEESSALRDKFMRVYSGLYAWNNYLASKVDSINKIVAKTEESKRSEIVTSVPNALGRTRSWLGYVGFSELVNHPIQSLGADIIKIAMMYLYSELGKYGGRIVASIHDELLVECPEESATQVEKLVREAMLLPEKVVMDCVSKFRTDYNVYDKYGKARPIHLRVDSKVTDHWE